MNRPNEKTWDEIDQWAETIGKHIKQGKPPSEHNQVLSTAYLDQLWNKALKEISSIPTQVQL